MRTTPSPGVAESIGARASRPAPEQGSAAGGERRQASAHVGDQLLPDLHQREPEQVLAAVTAVGVAGAPHKVARAVLSERVGVSHSASLAFLQ